MSALFVQTEAMIFVLIIMIFLYAFTKNTFDYVFKEHHFIYSFAIAGILFSGVSGFLAQTYVQIPLFALSGCCYAVSLFFVCKYVFIGKESKNIKLKTVMFLLLTITVGVLNFLFLLRGIGAITYLLVFVIVAVFALEQFNKIRVDKLTGLYNRYGLDIELRKQLRQYRRKNSDSFYVISCDMDKFKHINDQWGHLEGDRALKLVSDTLIKASENFDADVFRIGGDEFVIITDTSEEGLAREITDAIKKEFDNIKFRDDFDLNISIGYALYDGVISIKDLIDRADKKLYEAKKLNHSLR